MSDEPEWKKHWTETQGIHEAADQVQENIRSLTATIAKQKELIDTQKRQIEKFQECAKRARYVCLRDIAPLLRAYDNASIAFSFRTPYGDLMQEKAFYNNSEARGNLKAFCEKYGGFRVIELGARQNFGNYNGIRVIIGDEIAEEEEDR